jgi:hypothetical protein
MAALIGTVLPVKAIADDLRTYSDVRELAFLNAGRVPMLHRIPFVIPENGTFQTHDSNHPSN